MRRSFLFLGGALSLLCLAGCGGSAGAPAVAAPGAGAASATAASGPVTVTLSEFSIELDRKSIPAGTTSFRVVNRGAVAHELTLVKTPLADDKLPVKEVAADVAALSSPVSSGQVNAGQEQTKSIEMPADKYVLICNLPGHYAAGMHIALTVS